MRHLLSLGDLHDDEIQGLVERSLSPEPPPVATRVRCLATLFSSSSLRTRVGFETAAHRLGWQSSHVADLRFDDRMSATESLADTLRTISGMVDVVVARGPYRLRSVVEDAAPTCPVICGGDLTEHPSQTIIDAATIARHAARPLRTARIGLLGDLTMRAARSLLGYFARFPPAEVRLLAAPGREAPDDVVDPKHVTHGGPNDVEELDVLYVVGLPAGSGANALDEDQRRPFIVGDRQLAALPADAIVLSPLPVIDELSGAARRDARLRIWEQNEIGVTARMAILDSVVRQLPFPG